MQFSEAVSEKNLSVDFYHNRGKDSYIDLRALSKLEKVEFSEDSDAEEKIKKKKKKRKKIKKEDEREYTQEEKAKIKIYKKANHLLRKVIKKYKKRNNINENEYEIKFQFWQNFINLKNIINNDININEIETNQENGMVITKNNNNDNKEEKINDLNKLIEINNKTNNEIISILKQKHIDDKQFNNLGSDIYKKILIANNKKISCYKLFCLYHLYKDNFSFLKKACFKKWNKMK